MTKKQENFCREYKKDRDPVRAALRAGYTEKSARGYARALLKNEEIRIAVEEREEESVADEVLRLLTAIARGEASETVLTRTGEAAQCPPGIRERLKAIELIERRLSAAQGEGPRTVWLIRDDL